ncbi:MAG: alkaline phosphatase family protein [Candidatus Aenigmatarchaeota archaeon]
MTSKVLVIGLDGVGWEAVRDNGFEYLKQDSFGRVTSKGIDLKTPPIWSSFLTGVKDTGIYDFPKDNSRMGAAGKHEETLYERLENYDGEEICDGGIGYRRDELNVDPWVEKYDYEAINFPIYNYTNDFKGIDDWQLYWGSKCLDGQINPKGFVKKLAEETQDILRKTKESAQKDNDITLSYIHDTDYICHIVYMHHGFKKPVLYFWRVVENQVRQVVNSLDEEPLVVMLSDHGSSVGDVTERTASGHSPYGFFSFNKNLDIPEELHITEFKDIIEDYLGGS